MNNVHDDGPSIFQTRWAMSFLAGPLARGQIADLMADQKAALETIHDHEKESVAKTAAAPTRPVLPQGIGEAFLSPSRYIRGQGRRIYRPAMLGEGTLHFVRSAADLDTWVDIKRLLKCGGGVPEDLWQSSVAIDPDAEWSDQPDASLDFLELPDGLRSVSNVKTIQKQFKDYLYRHHPMDLYKSPVLKKYAPPGLSEAEARLHFQQDAREYRDTETEKLRMKYLKKMNSLELKIRTAEARLAKESEQYDSAKLTSLFSLGSSLLSAFVGKKFASRTNVSKMSTAARGATRAAEQRGDVKRAEQALEQLRLDMDDLNAQLEAEINDLTRRYESENLELEVTTIPPRKSDLKINDPMILWTPWQIERDGDDESEATPLF